MPARENVVSVKRLLREVPPLTMTGTTAKLCGTRPRFLRCPGRPNHGRGTARSCRHQAEEVLADLGIANRIVRKADGPPDASGPGSAEGYPGNPGFRIALDKGDPWVTIAWEGANR